MASIDANYDAIVAADELNAEELAKLAASIEAVEADVFYYIDARVIEINTVMADLNGAIAAAIADGDQSVIDKLNSDREALQAEIAAIELIPGPAGPAGASGYWFWFWCCWSCWC